MLPTSSSMPFNKLFIYPAKCFQLHPFKELSSHLPWDFPWNISRNAFD